MLDALGKTGIAGVVLLVVGIGVIAYESLVLAAGISLVIAGIGLVAQGVVSSALRSFGMF